MDFNWKDDDSVIVKPFEGIAVYTNPNGDIVLRQTNDCDEDRLIFIPPMFVDEVVAAILRERDEDQS